MVKFTTLEYYHSFRPPHRNNLFVSPSEVSSIRQLPYDERRSETVSEIVMRDGAKHLVEGHSDAIAAALGAEEQTTAD